jgi:hypothetical protein
MTKALLFGETPLLHVGLSLHPCICHNEMNAFGHKYSLASHQYRVNIGRPRVNIS